MEHSFDVLRCVNGLSNAELIARLQRLASQDRALSAKLLVHLGEVDARGLYREQAYSSMFEYAVTALRMSEAEAYLRIHAARLGRRFPLVVELLGQGAVHLTAIKLLGPHLTQDNHAQLLERARGKRKREIEHLVAEISPQPDVPNLLRKLPDRQPRLEQKPGAAEVPNAQPMHAAAAVLPTRVQVGAPAAPSSFQTASSTPLRPGRFKLQVSIDQQAHEQLEQLKDLLRHQIPNGDLARILELAVKTLHKKALQQRFARTSEPRVTKPKVRPRRSRYIPRAVVREVHARDEGKCSFVSEDGRRCSERGFLELHHHAPFARGGASTPDNLMLMCRTHNALLAERDYGAEFMRRATQSAPRRCQAQESMAQLET